MRVSTFLIALLSGVILALSVLIAMGCGGGSDDSSSSGKPNPLQQASERSSGSSSDSGEGPSEQADGSQASEADGSQASEADGSQASEADGSQEVESQSGSASGGEPLSKAAFIKEGDKICTGIPAEFQKLYAALEEEKKAAKEPKPSPAEISEKAAVPPLKVAVTKFEGLASPAGDEQEIKAIIAALESAAKGLEKNPTAEFTGPESPFAEFEKLSGQYGFKVCKKV